MESKIATRVLVALILLCLVILVVWRLREAEPTPQAIAPGPASQPEAASAVQEPDAKPRAVTRKSLPPEIIEKLTEKDIQIFVTSLLKRELLPEIRVWTAKQLAHAVAAPEAVDAALRAVLDDPDPEVAAAAAAALAQRGALGAEAHPVTRQPSPPREAGEAATPPGMRVENLD